MFKIDIDSEFNVKYGITSLEPEDITKRDIIRDFLNGISSVRHMIISQATLEVYNIHLCDAYVISKCDLNEKKKKKTSHIFPFLSSRRSFIYIRNWDPFPNSITCIICRLRSPAQSCNCCLLFLRAAQI